MRVPPYVPKDPDPRGLAILGEAPGANEMRQGRPFVGESGKLLEKALAQVGVDLKRCFITNAVDVYRDGNPTPSFQEVQQHAPRVFQELREQNCKQVLVLGNTAVQALLGQGKMISKVRGQWFEVGKLKCMATYHPAAILRNHRLFTHFATDLENWAKGADTRVAEPEVIIVEKYADCRALGPSCHGEPLAFDIETSSLDPRTGALTAASVSNGQATLVYPMEKLWMLHKFFQWQKPALIGHNIIAFDVPYWKHHFKWAPPILADTMLMRYASGSPGPYDLKNLASTLCGAPEYAINPIGALPEFLHTYVGYDAYYTWHLYHRLRQTLDTPAYRWIHDHALAISVVQQTGCLIDIPYLESVERQLEAEALENRLAVPGMNPLSSQQVLQSLRAAGVYADDTKAETLRQIDHELAEHVLETRKGYKLLGIVKGLKEKAQAAPDGRVRTSFLMHGTTTGRLASRDPNLQNIPRGPLVRRAFIAPPGWLMLEADYSQLEFRVAAYLSRDKRLIGHFLHGEDMHKMVASSAFGKPIEEITKEERTIAKNIGFGILYGAGKDKVAEFIHKATDCGMPTALEMADQVLHRLKQDYRQLFRWTQQIADRAVKEQEVRTPLGRVRTFDLITTENLGDVKREAVNTPIQSTASDICLHALKTLVENPLHGELYRVVLTVHDSILCEVREEYAQNAKLVITTTMRNSPRTILTAVHVPWDVEAKLTRAWGEETGE
jgi:DNA polymerase-1